MESVNDISILIVTYKRPHFLDSLISQLLGQTILPKFIIIIDNDKDKSALPIVEKYKDSFNEIDFTYKVNYINSLTTGRNLGVDLVHTNLVFILDDDISISNNYVGVMSQSLYSLPKAIGVQASLSFPTRSKTRNFYSRFFRHFHLTKRKSKVFSSINGSYPNGLEQTLPLECEWFSGTNQLYYTDVLRLIRWDENLIAYGDGEDIDHSFRINKSGLGKIWLIPSEKITHFATDVSRNIGYSAIFMREAYSYYLLYKLFGPKIQYKIKFTWSRLGFVLLEILKIVKTISRNSKLNCNFEYFKALKETFLLRHDIRNGNLDEVNKRILQYSKVE
jgi:GT2 family glycosyltransferase